MGPTKRGDGNEKGDDVSPGGLCWIREALECGELIVGRIRIRIGSV
jgi:hypothetical protein